MKWFFIDESITEGDRRQGPYSITEIRDFVSQGKISNETLVWHHGLESWITWQETDEAKLETNREELLKSTIDAILQEQAKQKRYAGFLIRAGAFVIDNLILSLVGAIILLIFSMASYIDLVAAQSLAEEFVKNPTSVEAMQKLMEVPGMGTFFSVWSIVQALYFIILHAKYSATIGKKIFHIHVETSNGENINWGFSVARYLSSIFTQLTSMFYGLGYLIVCVDPKRRALHDWIARTYVVHDPIKIEIRSKDKQEY